MGSLVQSFLRFEATANIPSLFGILVYKEETSNVTSNAPWGRGPVVLSLLMKCCVSLT